MTSRFGLGTLLFALAGCVPPEPPPRDDAPSWERLAVAEKTWDGILVELGSPAARPLLSAVGVRKARGWSYGETAPDGNTLRWATGESAAFRFESDRKGPHTAWLEVEPFEREGGPSQWVQPTVNGEALEPIRLRSGRARYPIDIHLAKGENLVELGFRYAAEPSRAGSDRRPLAVAFYRFDIPFSEDAAVRDGPFAWTDSREGLRGIVLPRGGALSFYLGPGEPGRLRVQLGASGPPELRAPRGARLRVHARGASGEIFTHVVETSEGSKRWERAVEPTGGPTLVTLEAENQSVWVRPELYVSRDLPGSSSASASTPPNIVVVVLDGANALRMSLYGHSRTTTPVIDRLGEEGVVFETAISQAVYTIASTGSFLTGQYPDRHRSVSFADRLREEAVTLPSLLSEAGFRTAAFSGNAVVSKAFGLDRGYESFHAVWTQEEYTGRGDSVVRAFRNWLEGVDEEPFFAYVHFREPHFPYDPPPDFSRPFGPETPFPEGVRDWDVIEAYNRRAASGDPLPDDVRERLRALYEGNLSYVDSLVADVLACLEDRALADETLLVLTADHGEALYEHGYIGHNTQLYEESIRVPLLFHANGMTPRRIGGVVELVDLTPTLLDVAGLAGHPALGDMGGRSLVRWLDGEHARSQRVAFSRTVWDEPRYSARSEGFKLIWDTDTGHEELYDLKRDPRERRDVLSEEELWAGFLRQRLHGWLREQEAMRAGSPPPASSVITEEQREILNSIGYLDVP